MKICASIITLMLSVLCLTSIAPQAAESLETFRNGPAKKLYISAMKDVRKARKAENRRNRLKLFKSALYKLEDLIDVYPDDPIAVRLLSGVMNDKNWFRYLDRQIITLEQDAEKFGTTDNFAANHQHCLAKLTPECVAQMYAAKVKSFKKSGKKSGDKKNQLQFSKEIEAFAALAAGDDKLVLKLLRRGGDVSKQLLSRLLRTHREELAVELLIRAERTLLFPTAQINSRTGAMQALKDHFQKPYIHRDGLDYKKQAETCENLARDEREAESLRKLPEIARNMAKKSIKLMNSLCHGRPIKKQLRELLNHLFKDEIQTAFEQFKAPMPSRGNIFNKMHTDLLVFGRKEEALMALYLIPHAKLVKKRNSFKLRYRLDNATLRYLIDSIPVQRSKQSRRQRR